MADQDKDATQQGASAVEGAEQQQEHPSALTARFPERESEMDRIAARRLSELQGKSTEEEPPKEEPAKEQAAEPAKEDPKAADAAGEQDSMSLAAQIAKQLSEGAFVLTDDILSKAVVTTKVDGIEEVVPAAKALGQYQKGAAADVRLAKATQASQEAADLLRKAQETAAAATTAATKKADEEKQVATTEEFSQLTKDHAAAVFSGDDEKAAGLLAKLIDLRVAGRTPSATPAAPTVDEIAQRVTPAIQQRLDVDRALTQLKADYPEIFSDSDYTQLADKKREEFEAQGKSRPEAIALAGEEMGKKFGIGKHKATDVQPGRGATTLTQKLAAKEGLDEPKSAATRAATTAALPLTHSQIIAQMAEGRKPGGKGGA